MNQSHENSLIPITSINKDGTSACSPFKLEIKLSMDSYIVQNLKNYTIADMLIDVAGIARAFHFMGMVLAIFTSKILYRKELI